MTCIIGLIQDGNMYIGGDSAGTSGYRVQIRKDRKVFKKGEFLFGFSSSFRMGQVLQYHFEPPEIECKNLHEYMVKCFIFKLRICFEKHNISKRDEEGDEILGGRILVCVQSQMFIIDTDFQVAEVVQNYVAIGCGEEFALGSLFSTTGLEPESRIIKALESSEEFSNGVRGPFHIEKL